MVKLFDFKLELAPHPARAVLRDAWGEVVLDDNGQEQLYCPITDQQSVMSFGKVIAYCGTEPNRPICFILPVSDDLKNAVTEFVCQNVGEPKSVNQAPIVDLSDEDEDE